MKELATGSVKPIVVSKVNGYNNTSFTDVLSVEEPLEIRISYGGSANRVQKNISVTMRTPGNDAELAVGFLFTEGIIDSYTQIKSAAHMDIACTFQRENIVVVELTEECTPFLQQSDRNFYTTSSCGICGKSSIQSVKTVSPFNKQKKAELKLSKKAIYQLREKLSFAQDSFAVTGGIHASGIFTIQGDLLVVREDVGRHNALDKLIGNRLMNSALPLNRHILLLSGRASFELVQKAAQRQAIYFLPVSFLQMVYACP